MNDTRRRGAAFTGATFGLLALGFSGATGAHAQTVYIASSDNEFGTLDLATGLFTQTGSISVPLYGMGFTTEGILYGVAADSSNGVYQIDPVDGHDSLKGQITNDAVFAVATSGNLIYGLDPQLSATLFVVNPSDLATKDIKSNTGISADGLLASKDGVLFATGAANGADEPSLYRLTTTGTVMKIGATGVSDPFFTGLFVGGTLYGFNSDGNIYTLDTTTGAASLLCACNLGNPADPLDSVYGVAFAPAAAPEPSQTAALGLGGLALSGLVFRARKRSARIS